MATIDTSSEKAWMYDGFDVRAWAHRSLHVVAICQLFAKRSLTIGEFDYDDNGRETCRIRCVVDETHECHATTGDIVYDDWVDDPHDPDFTPMHKRKTEKKPPTPYPATIECECETCNKLSMPEKLVLYLRKGLITLDDLHGPYGNTILPSGFVIDHDIGNDIYETWKVYDKKLEKRIAEAEVDPDSNIGPNARSLDARKKQLKETAKEESRRVCSYFRVDAHTIDENGNKVGYRIAYYDASDTPHTHDITEALVDGEGSALFQEFARIGVSVNPDPQARTALRRLLKSWTTDRTVLLYSRPGWHHDNTVFLTPVGRPIFAEGAKIPARTHALQDGACVADKALPDSPENDAAWRQDVMAEIWKGDTDQFAFASLTSCCGALTALLDTAAPVFLFHGPTTTGKTTAQVVAASGVANPRVIDEQAQGTLVIAGKQKVSDVARRSCGTCLHIDDTKSGNLDVETYVYKTAADSGAPPGTISSEFTPVQLFGANMPAGLTVRLLAIDFGSVPRSDPARVERIANAAAKHCGSLLMPFVLHLMDEFGWHKDTAKLQERVNAYADAYVAASPGIGPDKVPEWRRAARAFGILRACGDVYLSMGLLPEGVSADDVDRVVAWGWNTYRNGRQMPRAADPVAASLKALEDWLAASAAPVGAPAPSHGVLAWVAMDGTAYIRTEAMGSIPGVLLDRQAFVKALHTKGRLRAGTDGHRNLTWQVVPGHGRIKHYRVTP